MKVERVTHYGFMAWVVVGDTFYFRSLQILGSRRALIMATTRSNFLRGPWLDFSQGGPVVLGRLWVS